MPNRMVRPAGIRCLSSYHLDKVSDSDAVWDAGYEVAWVLSFAFASRIAAAILQSSQVQCLYPCIVT